MKLLLKITLFFLTLFAINMSFVFASGDIPETRTDLANIINDDVEANLNRYLVELQQKTSVEMAILTIESLEGQPIEDLSIEVARDKWKLGQKGKDNGILILVSLQDRKYRFEVGYDLENVLPDRHVGNIGREYLVPYFKKGDYSTGIEAATLTVMCEISKSKDIETSWMANYLSPGQREANSAFKRFTQKHDVDDWPSMDSLTVNPFIYQGKNIALVSRFNTMMTAKQGIFKSNGEMFVVSKIPKGLFKEKSKVVIVGRVLGKTEITMGLSLLVPHLKYVGHYFCLEERKCSDLIPSDDIKTCDVIVSDLLMNERVHR
jgi:uncharacterized membrane protein YgcG